MPKGFLPRSVPNRHSRRTLRNKCFSGASVPTGSDRDCSFIGTIRCKWRTTWGVGDLASTPAIPTIHFVRRRDIGAIRPFPKTRSCSHNAIREAHAREIAMTIRQQRLGPGNLQKISKVPSSFSLRSRVDIPPMCLSMSNLTFFIVLAGLLLFPGPAPADEAESIAALCARPGLQALREAQEEMTVRDTAAATGIKESTLRQLLKGLPKEGEIRCGG